MSINPFGILSRGMQQELHNFHANPDDHHYQQSSNSDKGLSARIEEIDGNKKLVLEDCMYLGIEEIARLYEVGNYTPLQIARIVVGYEEELWPSEKEKLVESGYVHPSDVARFEDAEFEEGLVAEKGLENAHRILEKIKKREEKIKNTYPLNKPLLWNDFAFCSKEHEGRIYRVSLFDGEQIHLTLDLHKGMPTYGPVHGPHDCYRAWATNSVIWQMDGSITPRKTSFLKTILENAKSLPEDQRTRFTRSVNSLKEKIKWDIQRAKELKEEREGGQIK